MKEFVVLLEFEIIRFSVTMKFDNVLVRRWLFTSLEIYYGVKIRIMLQDKFLSSIPMQFYTTRS